MPFQVISIYSIYTGYIFIYYICWLYIYRWLNIFGESWFLLFGLVLALGDSIGPSLLLINWKSSTNYKTFSNACVTFSYHEESEHVNINTRCSVQLQSLIYLFFMLLYLEHALTSEDCDLLEFLTIFRFSFPLSCFD